MNFDGTEYITTGVISDDIGINGAATKTCMAWARPEAFDDGGVWDLGSNGTDDQFCLRTTTPSVEKEGAFLDAGFPNNTTNPITGTGITLQGISNTNRVLIVFTMCEQRPVVTNSVCSWGGVGMTLIVANDEIVGGGGRDGNLRAWVLDEAGIQSAVGNTLSTTWSGTTDVRREACGQFFNWVDQTTPTGNTKVAETQVALCTYTSTTISNTDNMHVICNQGNNSLAYISSSLTVLTDGDLDTILLNSQSCALTVGLSDGASQTMTITNEATTNRNGGVSFSLFADTTSSWRAQFWVDDDDFSSPSSINQWNHYSLVYDGTDSLAYVNGVLLKTFTTALTTGTDLPFTLGNFRFLESALEFDGQIADARIYDRDLSASELLTIYNSLGKDGIVNGLEGRWPLNDGVIGSSPQYWIDSTQASSTITSSLSVTMPSNEDDDLLFVAVIATTAGAAPTITTPGGWSVIDSAELPAAISTPRLATYRRIASGDSGPSSYSFAISASGGMIAIACSYRNVNTTEDAVANSSGITATQSSPLLSGSTERIAIRVMGSDDDDLPTSLPQTYPVGMEGIEAVEIALPGNGCSLVVAHEITRDVIVRPWYGFATNPTDEWRCLSITFLTGTGGVTDVSGNRNNGLCNNTPNRVTGVLRI